MIIMGAFYGVAGAGTVCISFFMIFVHETPSELDVLTTKGVPIFFGQFVRAAWISNLAGYWMRCDFLVLILLIFKNEFHIF